jgi:hypothetical protein
MSRAAKIVGVAAVVLAVLLAGGVTWAAVATWQAGAIRVSVRDHRDGGTDLAFVLPAVALDAALAVVPDDARSEIELDPEAARVLSMVSTVCAGLEKQDDFVLVDVSSDREKVRVEKRGAVLLVSVESAEESVSLEIPLASITRMARWLGTAAPAPPARVGAV